MLYQLQLWDGKRIETVAEEAARAAWQAAPPGAAFDTRSRVEAAVIGLLTKRLAAYDVCGMMAVCRLGAEPV